MNESDIQRFRTKLHGINADENHPQNDITKNINNALERGKFILKMVYEHFSLDRSMKNAN